MTEVPFLAAISAMTLAGITFALAHTLRTRITMLIAVVLLGVSIPASSAITSTPAFSPAISMLGQQQEQFTDQLHSTADATNGWSTQNATNLEAFGDLFSDEAANAIRVLMDTVGVAAGQVSDAIQQLAP